MKVIVTRPAAQAAAWVAQLQALGVDAAALPLIGILPPADAAPVQAAWQALPGAALVFFVSPNAVQHFFDLRPPGAPWPDAVRAASPGPGTSAALREAGLAATLVDEPAADAPRFDSEALWARLQHRDWSGRRVLVVRGEDGRDWLADTLRARGAQVHYVAAYRRVPPSADAAGRALLADAQARPAAHLWLFSSSEAVGHLQALAPGARWAAAWAAASHPRIVQAARAAGFGRVDLVPPDPARVAQLAQAPPMQPLTQPPIQSAPL